MNNRRSFLKKVAWLGPLLGTGVSACKETSARPLPPFEPQPEKFPIVISTWNFGAVANEVAWEVLASDGTALDAVEAGARLAEGNPEVSTVGYGGRPDREGVVTLDASIMQGNGACGSVCFLEGIKHPVSVARKVMEETPHVMLAGEGAQAFAVSQGFEVQNMLTEKAREAWLNWKEESNYQPVINVENHDTIGLLAMDASGRLAGACTTSGLAFKMRGRVGDSPLIGPGLFVAEGVGAAVATGMGEEIIRENCSFLAVEFLRQGYSAQQAAEKALERIRIDRDKPKFQACLIVLRADGAFGGAALRKGFTYCLKSPQQTKSIPASFLLS